MENKTCPQCGKTLRERNGKYGPFWGCSGYPECQYILKEGRQPMAPKRDFTQQRINQAIQDKNKRIDQFADRKEESIDTWAAINNATMLTTECLKKVPMTTTQIIDQIKDFAEGIRKMARIMKRENVFKQEGFNQGEYNANSELDEANQFAEELPTIDDGNSF